MKLSYSYTCGPFVLDELLEECSNLYSNHYGTWSKSYQKSPGGSIQLSARRIREWLRSEDSRLACVYDDNTLIGYAIAVQSKVPGFGVVSWVTQLVVHTDYRNSDVGKTLLFSIWGLTDHFAWGIITANPYAVRALEKATRRRSKPSRIKMNYRKLINLGKKAVPYISEETETQINKRKSKINTRFFLDHSQLKEMITNVTHAIPWELGDIEEGWEWFAFTFQDQEQIALTSEEISKMLDVSDQITKQAYSRMIIESNSSSHSWAKFTEHETEMIIDYCNLSIEDAILDLGCGIGRHSIVLGEKGYSVLGVDYIKEFIDIASKKAENQGIGNISFLEADCCNIDIEQKFDAIICLYDVIGTYVDNTRNIKIINNIVKHLKPKGRALISVMNYDLAERRAKNFFSIDDEPNKLLELQASKTMEQSGEIFNPDYYMIDINTKIVYRREQFTSGGMLPIELIVRDRRFKKEEIEEMCRESGLEVIWTKYVHAGMWKESVSPEDDHSKEILILCQKI